MHLYRCGDCRHRLSEISSTPTLSASLLERLTIIELGIGESVELGGAIDGVLLSERDRAFLAALAAHSPHELDVSELRDPQSGDAQSTASECSPSERSSGEQSPLEPRGRKSPSDDPVETSENEGEPELFSDPRESQAFVAPSIPGLRMLGIVGRGGMGIVYDAHDIALRRRVACKVLYGPFPGIVERGRFQREAEAIARLDHPDIVRVYTLGEAQGNPYITMEFLQGMTLRDYLRGRPQLPRDAAMLVARITDAVEHAHQKGVLHRDLKPSNILLAPTNTVASPERVASLDWTESLAQLPLVRFAPKILDFGLAKFADAATSNRDDWTLTGQILGTPSFAAPEQLGAQREPLGPTVDVYSVGAILYQMLTGVPPFPLDDLTRTLERIRDEEPLPPRVLRPSIPADLETICCKCLAKRPRDRYPNMRSLGDDLRSFAKGASISARPIGALRKTARLAKRRPVAVLVSLLMPVAFLLVSFATWYFQREANRERQLREAQVLINASQNQLNENLAQLSEVLDSSEKSERGWHHQWRTVAFDRALETGNDMEALAIGASMLADADGNERQQIRARMDGIFNVLPVPEFRARVPQLNSASAATDAANSASSSPADKSPVVSSYELTAMPRRLLGVDNNTVDVEDLAVDRRWRFEIETGKLTWRPVANQPRSELGRWRLDTRPALSPIIDTSVAGPPIAGPSIAAPPIARTSAPGTSAPEAAVNHCKVDSVTAADNQGVGSGASERPDTGFDDTSEIVGSVLGPSPELRLRDSQLIKKPCTLASPTEAVDVWWRLWVSRDFQHVAAQARRGDRHELHFWRLPDGKTAHAEGPIELSSADVRVEFFANNCLVVSPRQTKLLRLEPSGWRRVQSWTTDGRSLLDPRSGRYALVSGRASRIDSLEDNSRSLGRSNRKSESTQSVLEPLAAPPVGRTPIRELRSLPWGLDSLTAVDLGLPGTHDLLGFGNGEVRAFRDLETGLEAHAIRVSVGAAPIEHVLRSPDGRWVLAIDESGTWAVLDGRFPQVAMPRVTACRPVVDALWFADSARFVTLDRDGLLTVWRLPESSLASEGKHAEEGTRLRDPGTRFPLLGYTEGGESVLAIRRSTLEVWSGNQGRRLSTLATPFPARFAAFATQADAVVITGGGPVDGPQAQAAFFSRAGNQFHVAASLPVLSGLADQAIASDGSQWLVWDQQRLHLMRLPSFAIEATITPPVSRGHVVHAAFLHSGEIAYSTSNGWLVVWNRSAGAESQVWRHELPDSDQRIAFHPQGKAVFAFGLAGLQGWRRDTGERIVGLPLELEQHGVSSFHFDPTGQYALTVSRNSFAQVWNARDWTPAGPAIDVGEGVADVQFTVTEGVVAVRRRRADVRLALEAVGSARGNATSLWLCPLALWDWRTGRALSSPNSANLVRGRAFTFSTVPFLVGFGGDARLRFLPWPCSNSRSDDERRLLAAQYSHRTLGSTPSPVIPSDSRTNVQTDIPKDVPPASPSIKLTARELEDGWRSWRQLAPTLSNVPAAPLSAANDSP
ncbi:MAG: WD40 repeat domain-containing serine/threonine protein kinase [Planctomycetota bacterium]